MKGLNLQIPKIIKAALIVAMVLFGSSCEKWLGPGVNTDPSFASEVPMSALIPAIQLDMGYNLMGNDVVRITGIWMQMFDHVGRASFGPIRNSLTGADVNNLWGNIYTTQLMNAKLLIEKAESSQSPYNAAVGQILMAYSLGIATDLWGDIPYQTALNGSRSLDKPVYDPQEQIYSTIHELLDQAILNLELDPADNLIDIGGDNYFDGDPEAWLKAARAIKARHFLQLSKRDQQAAYKSALELCNAFNSNDDNMLCPFTSDNQNPIYQFMEQRAGDLVMCSTLMYEMDTIDDPRIPFYFSKDDNGGISGSDPGSENDAASLPGAYLASQTSPTYLLTYAELKFIEAESAFQTGDRERSVTAYKTGVEASVLQVTGEANKAWLDTYINTENSGSISLEKIIIQKRHALVGQLQPYSDWRRTGIPDLKPVPGAFFSTPPQRYPYSQDELIYNTDNVPQIDSLQVPVWWAK